MNPNWQDFLHSTQAGLDTPVGITRPDPSDRQYIYPLTHLGVLTVSGKDAATLLQGQITCNINDVNAEQSRFAAVCNPKGRAIATFLLIKEAEAFHLLVPLEMLEILKKRLGLFILRSLVSITDNSDAYCAMGLSSAPANTTAFATRQQDAIEVNWLGRTLILATPEAAMAFWSAHTAQGYRPEQPEPWRLRDLTDGIPWLSPSSSEEFVPQMLNLDTLGGISFNKGCYTGQEVIARTHYLGKNKRAMFLATAPTPDAIEGNAKVLDRDNQTVGYVLTAQADGKCCKLLIVIQLSETQDYKLKLADDRPLTVIPFTATPLFG